MEESDQSAVSPAVEILIEILAGQSLLATSASASSIFLLTPPPPPTLYPFIFVSHTLPPKQVPHTFKMSAPASKFKVADISLAAFGRREIELAEHE